MTWRSGDRCEDNNGGEESEFPAAILRRLERTPGVRQAMVGKEAEAEAEASFGGRKKKSGNLKERKRERCVSGNVESSSFTVSEKVNSFVSLSSRFGKGCK